MCSSSGANGIVRPRSMHKHASAYASYPPVAESQSIILPPPRADDVGTALILVLTALVAIAPIIHPSAQVAIGVSVTLTTALSARRRSRQAFSLGLFWTLVAAAQLSGVYYQQVTFGCSIVAYGIIVWAVPSLGFTMGWARRGRLTRDVLLLMIAVVLTSSVALVCWYRLTAPDLNDLVHNFVPDLSPAVLLIGAVGFSMANALVEEVAYRGVLMHALDAAVGVSAASVVVQAIPFGMLHYGGGFPRGWVGVVLAIGYGIMMGLIRRRAQGMLAPWLAHVLTDISIAAIVLSLAR